RPKAVDLTFYTLAELLYYAAVWMHLDGNPWMNLRGDEATGPAAGYALTIFVRIAVTWWIMAVVARDIWWPRYDPLSQERDGRRDQLAPSRAQVLTRLKLRRPSLVPSPELATVGAEAGGAVSSGSAAGVVAETPGTTASSEVISEPTEPSAEAPENVETADGVVAKATSSDVVKTSEAATSDVVTDNDTVTDGNAAELVTDPDDRTERSTVPDSDASDLAKAGSEETERADSANADDTEARQ
ncbi:MAG: hypothetical protein LBL92_03030, partial [Propionibacteriaceae bacterium]|nr:hypothetical protein [Propionibacteriaceae bacterium]